MPDERMDVPVRGPLTPAKPFGAAENGRTEEEYEAEYADEGAALAGAPVEEADNPWEEITRPAPEPPSRAHNPYADAPVEEVDNPWEEITRPAPEPPSRAHNPYARPRSESGDGVSDLSARFAPPPKFELPRAGLVDRGESFTQPVSAAPNVYQTRRAPLDDAPEAPSVPGTPYRVEAAGAYRRRSGHTLRTVLIVLGVLIVLAGGAYLARDWLTEQFSVLFGEDLPTAPTTVAAPAEAAGYDPAPALQVGKKARQGVEAVTSGLELEQDAVTERCVVQRQRVGENAYDYYLFAADTGRLLGYFDGLAPERFLVLPDGGFYVGMPPYLLDAEGDALIPVSAYAQAAGADAVLGPMIGGWSIIRDAAGTRYNYINASGTLLSPLWFCEAYPFTGQRTVAYVDTGNPADPEERYVLYELTRGGEMILWKHAANTDEVLGSACDAVYLSTGEVVLLDGQRTVLCQSDDVTIYLDCDALVARDPATGLYALYVHNEQHYDYAYASIAPVSTQIPWTRRSAGGLTLCAVTGATYPQALSYHFALTKPDGQEERVALSTTSVYPIPLYE